MSNKTKLYITYVVTLLLCALLLLLVSWWTDRPCWPYECLFLTFNPIKWIMGKLGLLKWQPPTLAEAEYIRAKVEDGMAWSMDGFSFNDIVSVVGESRDWEPELIEWATENLTWGVDLIEDPYVKNFPS